MDEMIEQALSHVNYYLSFGYDHGSVTGSANINLSDVATLTVDFFKRFIQASYNNNTNYNVVISLEYSDARKPAPYEVKLLNTSLFDYETSYDQIKDKTIGQCVLERLNNLKIDKYDELSVAAIERLKEYLISNAHQKSR